MIRCKHVADALAATNFCDLAPHRRLAALLHISLCPCCGQFHRDVIRHQETAREYSDGEHMAAGILPDATRASLRALLKCSHPIDDRQDGVSGRAE